MRLRTLVLTFAAVPAALFGQVTVLKNVGNPTQVAGGPAFTYTITVSTVGAGPLTVVDPLPPGIVAANNNVAVVGTPLSCTAPPVGENGNVVCSNPSYPAGGSSTITIVAQAIANLSGGVRTNTAIGVQGVLTSAGSVGITVTNNANLMLTKEAPGSVRSGELLVYHIAVTNNGASSGVNVVVSDNIPFGTTFVAVQGTEAFHDGCAYQAATNKIVCNAGFLPTGTHEINLTVKVTAKTGSITNQATLAAAVGTVNGSPAIAGATMVTAPAIPVPTTTGQCMNGGWATLARPDGSPFKNQGDCISFVNTGN